jgi:hypothetical protein
MKHRHEDRRTGAVRRVASLAVAVGAASLALGSTRGADDGGGSELAPTLEATRLVLGKWIETQRILSKERDDWQQGKEILASRIELVRRELAGLDEKLAQAQGGVTETNAKRDELLAQDADLVAAVDQLTAAATRMEADVRREFARLPEPLRAKLAPLRERIPDDPATTRASAAERFQNVLGILNELNKANGEITVACEVRELAHGRPSEVRVAYVGLAQAYYVSASGEAGIGRPGADGWTWEPSNAVANDVLSALEMVQGKQTPAFVPLPVRLR